MEELRDEKARWQDPSYVEQQARERLNFLRPGETGFILPQERDGEEDDDGRRTSGAPAARPWYDTLWEHVDRSDRAGRSQ